MQGGAIVEFKNKVVVVTGGANGIGKEIANAFKKEGAIVAIIDKEKSIPNCDYFHHGDISEKTTLDAFVDKILSKYKKVDYIINNACLSRKGILSECSYEDFLYVQKTGVIAPYYLVLKLKQFLQGDSVIINISSTRAYMSQEDTESYSAAKGGITALTHSLAASLKGIARVNAIAPGWIDTSQGVWSKSDYNQHLTKSIGKTIDIANIVLFLCSKKGRFITGQTFIVDGGMTKNMIYHGEHGWSYEDKNDNDEN
ncbi:MAG: SDR family oxidoreductase [Clostridia bacterium]